MEKTKKNAYDRILEILDDYWLSEPDELYVKISMEFVKADGQHQEKCIMWRNPDYEDERLGPVEVREELERAIEKFKKAIKEAST